MQPTVTIEPNECLADENVNICVGGLHSDQNVTVQALLKIDGDIFKSFAHYSANRDGTIDLARQASTGGSYRGIEAMGLFQSMKPSPANKRMKQRLMVKDVENPAEVSIRILDFHLNYNDLCNGNSTVLAEASAKRWYKSPGVRRISVRWRRVRGTLFVPEGDGPFPGLIDLFGVIGGITEYRASLLASRGYMALALAYFDYDDLPKNPIDFDLGYFEEAKEFLETHPLVYQNGIGMVGNSLGGTLALACATYIPGIACAVSINGPAIVFRGTMRYKDSVWVGNFGNQELLYDQNGIYAEKYLFDEEYDLLRESARIEFAGCNKSFLFIFGKDDDEINSPKIASVVDKLTKNGKGDYKIVMYPGAGHLLEPPHFPHVSSSYMKIFGLQLSWGGQPKMHAKAQILAWGEILAFLKKNLSKELCKL